MARVLIRFDGGNVPIVTGDVPPDDATPISDPQPTDFVTNQAFIVAPGAWCFGLEPGVHCTPLWQVVRAVEGEETVASFKKRP
jgi:hypothetical protein